jgi:hypothetical protein
LFYFFANVAPGLGGAGVDVEAGELLEEMRTPWPVLMIWLVDQQSTATSSSGRA